MIRKGQHAVTSKKAGITRREILQFPTCPNLGTGKTVYPGQLDMFQYLHRIRVEAASAMLRSENKTVLEICEQVGYSSPSSFNREFRRITGKSPREARRAYLENE